MTVRPGVPFGPLPLPDGVQPLVLDAAVGPLTALRARPSGPVRGVALLVPGFTGSKEDFRLVLPLLAAHGWDAWAYSQRGQVDSAAPVGVEAYRARDFAADAVEVARIVADAAGARSVHLLGHSFGGTVAQHAAVLDPTAFTSLTLLCSGPHGWPGREDELRARLLAADGVDLWRLDNPDRAQLPDEALAPSDLFARQRCELTGADHLIGALDVLADPTDTTDAVGATGLPVLVVHGEDDDAWPQDWQRRSAARLGAPLVVIPGAGHLPNEEQPMATADALDAFWASIPRP
ncbi:MAG: alpha/beta hydrolase [Actinobacteria bacterium]|nr:alpha/beta hydrolase [Actinomycetota bacterium]MCG2803213.1 alpha/beta hydrolase [Cellulomonas sp.]